MPAASATETVTVPAARSAGMRNEPVSAGATGTRWAAPPAGVKVTARVRRSAAGSAIRHRTATVPSPEAAAESSTVGETRSTRTWSCGTIITSAGAGIPSASTVMTLNQ